MPEPRRVLGRPPSPGWPPSSCRSGSRSRKPPRGGCEAGTAFCEGMGVGGRDTGGARPRPGPAAACLPQEPGAGAGREAGVSSHSALLPGQLTHTACL